MIDFREPREARLAFRVNNTVAEIVRLEAEKRDEPISEIYRHALIEHLTRSALRVGVGGSGRMVDDLGLVHPETAGGEFKVLVENAESTLSNALAKAADAPREAGSVLELGPAYHPQVGWTTGYRQSIRAMISSIEFLAKELEK